MTSTKPTGSSHERFGDVKDFLLFRRFLTPVILQIMFWTGIGGTLYGTWRLYSHDNWAWIMSLIFGTLMTRLIFEFLILRFRSFQCLEEIKAELQR